VPSQGRAGGPPQSRAAPPFPHPELLHSHCSPRNRCWEPGRGQRALLPCNCQIPRSSLRHHMIFYCLQTQLGQTVARRCLQPGQQLGTSPDWWPPRTGSHCHPALPPGCWGRGRGEAAQDAPCSASPWPEPPGPGLDHPSEKPTSFGSCRRVSPTVTRCGTESIAEGRSLVLPSPRLFNLLGGEQRALGRAAGITRPSAGTIFHCSVSPVPGGFDFWPRLICRGKLITFV